MNGIPLCAMIALLCACGAKKEGVMSDPADADRTLMVYRTNGDHRDHVPIGLGADRSTIVSYPHPKDVRDHPSAPVELGSGYWLDQRGIGLNVAFLKMTYGEYAALERAPSLQEMEALIIDRDPLLELCDCGKRNSYTDPQKELKALVKQDALLSRCKRLK